MSHGRAASEVRTSASAASSVPTERYEGDADPPRVSGGTRARAATGAAKPAGAGSTPTRPRREGSLERPGGQMENQTFRYQRRE